MDDRKLYRSNTDKAIFGVCGGLAEYFGVDSLIVRLLFVLVTFGYGSGLLVYLIAALVIPRKPDGAVNEFAGYANAQNPQARYDGSASYTRVNPVFAGDAESAARIRRAAQKEMDEAMEAAEKAAVNAQTVKAAAEAAGKNLEEDADYIKAMAESSAAFNAYKEAADKAERVFRGDAANVEEAAAQIKAEAEKARAEAEAAGASKDTGYTRPSAERTGSYSYSTSASSGTTADSGTSQSYSYQSRGPASQTQAPKQEKSSKAGSKTMGTIGVALLAVGVMWILQRFFRHLPVFAIVLIIVGCYILFTKDK